LIGWILGMVLICANGNWVEMNQEYLSELTELVKEEFGTRLEQAKSAITEHSASWRTEVLNANRWKESIEQLKEKVAVHLANLEKSKDDILDHTKNQCINILQIQKLKCLNCVSTSCNNFVKDTCDFDAEAKNILKQIVDYLMELLNMQESSDDSARDMIERGTKDLHDSTDKLLYQLQTAKKALEDSLGSKVNLTTLKLDMLEVTETGKVYIKQIGEKIENSENVVDTLLDKDEEILRVFEEAKKKASELQESDGDNDKSIFSTVWEETKNVLSKAVCFITFGKVCPGDDKNDEETNKNFSEETKTKIIKLEELIKGAAPSCDQLQANISRCLYFLPRCESQCLNISINSICPTWFKEWKGYKFAWELTNHELENVYEELKDAEKEMITAIKKHNDAVNTVFKDYGWMLPYTNTTKENVGLIKIKGVKFDPMSFDPEIVNKFSNSTIQIELPDGDAAELQVNELADPYNAASFASIAMKRIEQFARNKHTETKKIQDLLNKFN